MVQHSIVKSKRSDAETSTGRGGLNQSILESKFKTELKPVFRKGFSTVYRMRIPDEIAECKDVQKTKCIRLKLLKPSLEGRALPQEDFTVKIYGKNVLVPMAIIVSKGLDKLKSPTTVTLEFLGPASRAERMPMPQSSTKESVPRSDARKVTRIEGIRDIHVTIRKPTPTPSKIGEKSTHDASPPETNEDTSQLKSEVESIRNEVRELNEKVKEHLFATKSTEPPAKEVIEPKLPAPPISPEEVLVQPHTATQVPSNQVLPPTMHPDERVVSVDPPKTPTPTPLPVNPAERLVSVDKPPKYNVIRVEEKPQPKVEEEKIRFERDGECVTIYKGKEQLSTVCMQKTVRGILYNCGKCDWNAMEKGGEGSGNCEHVEMVKKFLASSARGQ